MVTKAKEQKIFCYRSRNGWIFLNWKGRGFERNYY